MEGESPVEDLQTKGVVERANGDFVGMTCTLNEPQIHFIVQM